MLLLVFLLLSFLCAFLMIEDRGFLAQLRQVELALKPLRHSRKIGIHQLAHRGRSLEFAEYREYRPGDEPRDLDWKLFARSDRYFVKLRDTHTPATNLIVLDDSASMNFQSERASASKFQAALLLAFALGYVLHQQGDAFGFQTFSPAVPALKPRSSKKAFRYLVQQLQLLEHAGPKGLSFQEPALMNLPTFDHLFVISDFLLPAKECFHWLQQARILAYESSFWRISDPEEREPRLHRDVENLENDQEYRTLTAEDWGLYRQNFQRHESALRQACLQQKTGYRLLSTTGTLALNIQKLLYSRMHQPTLMD